MLVHCNAGRGRSVTVAMAYLLMKHKADGWDRYTALETVQAVRQTAPMLNCCETRPQWRTLCSFERRLHNGSLVSPDRYCGPPVPYARTNSGMTSTSSVPAAPEQAAAGHDQEPDFTCITPKPVDAFGHGPPGMADCPATPVQAQGVAEEEGGMLKSPGRARKAREILTPSKPHASSPQVLTLASATRGRLPLSTLRPLPPVAAAQAHTSYYEAAQDVDHVPMPALSLDPILPAPRSTRTRAAGGAVEARLEELVADESCGGVDVSASRASLSHVDLASFHHTPSRRHHTPARRPTEPPTAMLLPGTPMKG